MPAPLVTIDRWSRNPALAAANTAQPEYAQWLVNAASAMAELLCKRRFALTSYRLYAESGGYGADAIVLPNHPVVSVDRVCTRPQSVLSIAEVNPAAQLARVATTADEAGATAAVVLTAVVSAVTTTVSLTAANCPTIDSLASAVNASAGWTAAATDGFGAYPTADLRPLQGPTSAKGSGATLQMYLEGDGRPSFTLDAEAGILHGPGAGGHGVRVDYTAGFAVIPEPVQEAVVRMAQIAYQTAGRDGTVASQGLGPYRTTYSTAVPLAADDVQVRGWLAPYVSHSNLMVGR